MITVVIAAEGPNAEKAAAVAANFFKEEFGVEARRKVSKSPENEKILEHIDPNWISAILTVPSAVVASIELDQRFKLIERTNAMLTEVRRRLGDAGGVIRIGTVKTLDITTATAKDIVDAILNANGGSDAEK